LLAMWCNHRSSPCQLGQLVTPCFATRFSNFSEDALPSPNELAILKHQHSAGLGTCALDAWKVFDVKMVGLGAIENSPGLDQSRLHELHDEGQTRPLLECASLHG